MAESNDPYLQDYYRARAPEYEQIYYRDDPARQAELRSEAERLAALVRGKNVLELACGTGYWTHVMSRTAASILASDIAPEMLTEARKKSLGCEVTFRRADMFDEPFGTAAFDVVALGFWFSHQPRQDYDRLYDALTAPLKRDGLIWMVDNNPPAEWPSKTFGRTDAHGNNYKERTLDNGRKFEILKNYFTRTDLEAIFRPRFEILELRHGTYYWSAVLVRSQP